MSGYGGAGNEYWNNPPPMQPPQNQPPYPHQQQHNSYNFNMPEQYEQQFDFQTYDTNDTANSAPPPPYSTSAPYSGAIYDPTSMYGNDVYTGQKSNYLSGNEFEDEPPLLEELGINPSHIMQKTLSVLNPFRSTEQSILQDTDMAGPLVFVLALGGFLLLSGKVTFSYIYGIGVMGCLAFYALLSLMATQAKVTLGSVISVLGYCILPMVVLSGINVLITLQGTLGTVFAGICIIWCSVSASKLFVTAYSMDHQQILIAYPCALLYGVFAFITIF